jgi:MFS family permease
MVFSSAFFALGWFGLSFSFPLLAVKYDFSYSLTGFLGFLVAYPFIIAAFVDLYLKDRILNIQIVLIPFIVSLMAIIFIFQTQNLIILLIAVVDMLEAFYWVAMEMLLGTGGENLEAEKYSTAWGVPSAVMPILSGIIIQSFGFRLLFLVAFLFLISGSMFRPKYTSSQSGRARSGFQLKFIIPMIFSGLVAGFVSYVLVPIFRIHGDSYILIGTAITIFTISSAIGFIIMNFTGKRSIYSLSAVSSFLLGLPLISAITSDLYLIMLMLVGSGIGISIAFSKILAYISERSSARIGILTYEGFFATGTAIGSFILGSAFQIFGNIAIGIVFTVPILYAVYMIIQGSITARETGS